MILNRVWDEMFKTKGYILQIEFFCDKKRKFNRNLSIAIVISAFANATMAFFPNCRVGTIIASLIVAVCTIINKWFPYYSISEEKLRELDDIHDFYKNYLQKLEKLFSKRMDLNTDIDDTKMISEFDKIVKTEKNNETRMNTILRDLSEKELKIISEQTNNYFKRTYQDNYE